jgi:hypothetical protein
MVSVRSALAVLVATSAITAIACDSGAKDGAPRTKPTTAPVSPSAIEPGLVDRCVTRYDCGMSHPGLGSYSNARGIDLATCTRTVTHDSGPYEHDEPTTGSGSGEHTRNTEVVPPERCAEIRKLLSSVTVADAAAAQEAAQVDTQACILDVTCPDGGPSKLRIQRQTTSGRSVVERLLRLL